MSSAELRQGLEPRALVLVTAADPLLVWMVLGCGTVDLCGLVVKGRGCECLQ